MTESDTAGMWMCMHAACVARRPSVATPVPRMQDVGQKFKCDRLNVQFPDYRSMTHHPCMVTWLSS